MAGPDSLRNLSNLDIIRLTKDIDRDEYYRLGGVLGFGEDILDHLWDPAQKGSALKVVLLWRDGLEPEVDQRAILGEKLSQAGLDDKWEYLLSGLPASPVASKSANSTRLKGSNAPVLPMKQSKQGNNGLHPSAVTERSDMIADSRPDEHNGKDDALPILLGITDDSDDSDGENYINVSNETLRKGSASIASVCSKPRLPSHSSEEINIPEERQSCLMESQPVVPPSKVSADSTTWVNDDQFQSQHDSGDKEAVKQSETEQDHDLQKSSTFNENLSIANSKSDPAETLRPVHAKPKIPVKPSRGAIDPMVLRQPVVNEKPNQPDDPQNNSEALQNTPIKDDKAQPSSSQPNTTLLNDEDVSMNVPSTDNTDGHKEADIAPLVSSDTMKLQGKLSTSVKDSYLLQTPVTQASTIQDDPRSEVGNGHQEPSYASTTAQLNSQGPPVAPYQTRSPVGPSISSSPQVPSIKHVPVTHSSSVTANRLTQLPGTLPKSLSQKGAHDAQSEPDRHFQRTETLPNKPMETTLDPSMNKQSSSFLIQQGLNEDVLRALAGDIATGDQLRKLGLELGFKEADINGFEAMNHRTTAQSMEGTFDMLLKWKSTVSGEDQSLLLKHALRRSNLVKMADSHLKTTKRRRDIRSVKIAKNFTVSDCREKLEFHYRLKTTDILKKLEFSNSDNDLPVIVVHRIVKRGKNMYVEKIPLLEGSVNEILRTRKNGALPTRIVIFGRAGIGKSTLVAQMAQEWVERVPGSPLQDVSLLFVLKMKFLDNHGSLGQAIVNQLLNDVRGLTAQGIDQLIEDNQSECMVVLDGVEEFRGEISSMKCGHVMRVVQNIQLMKCRVIVTSHPRLEDYFNKEDLPNDFLKMELQGLSKVQSTSFIRSFFRDNVLHTANELMVFLEMNDVINDLLATPLFCLLACHLWECNLLQLVTTESDFYDSVHRFFLKHGEEKASTSSGDTDLEMIVQGIGEVAFNGLLESSNKRAFGQNDFKKISATLQKAISLGIICKTSYKKLDDTGFEFYHHNAQEHCVAKYLSKEVKSKIAKGKHSRLDKALKQMAKKDLADFGRVLRFTAGLGSPSTGLQMIETIHSDNKVPLGDKTRMILDCLAEIPQLDKQTTYAVERCFAGGNVLINLPTIHTTIGFYKLPPFVKEKVQSVTIQSSCMPPHIAKRLSMGLQGYPNLLKLEVADVQNPTYPVILLLLNKLSLHLAPEGALSIIPDLNQSIFNGLRLVDLSDCYLSPEMTAVLWTALAKCPNIEVMTVKNSTILSRDLPRLGCIAVLQASFRSPVLPEDVGWMSSILGDAKYSTEVRLTIGDGEDGTIRRAGVGVQEHVLMVDDRIDLTNATGNTMKVLNVLPDSYRRKVRTLCIKRTRFTDDLIRPLLDFVHSLIRLETFSTEDRNIPEEIKQLQVFKGTFQRPTNELPTMGEDGVLKGSVSSPLREEEFERLSSAFGGPTTIQQVHIIIEHDRRSETNFQELLDITGDSMELCNVSSTSIEIMKMFPASFRQKMHSARIKNCNLSDDLSQQLSETLQSMDELEMFLSENRYPFTSPEFDNANVEYCLGKGKKGHGET
ncbi:uncharacterized protein LOC115926429 [Strongylocentrotus purpuratus]|uniref:Uncharacterized protein n=1 Tax=Strongylocentrotus purpuratus TaxID=7668 RepID=A0A7M7T1J0_STRPU|nr:uncharacterized protein LOC115926429 [Strongylocentrotus purpuratus]